MSADDNSRTIEKLIGDSEELAKEKRERKKQKAISNYESEKAEKNGGISAMLHSLKTDTFTSREAIESEKESDNAKGILKNNPADDISSAIEDRIFTTTRHLVLKEVERITKATMRAISLRYTQDTQDDGFEDMVIKALEVVVGEKTKNISNLLADEVLQTISDSTHPSFGKRIDFNNTFREFLEIMYISKRIKELEDKDRSGDLITVRSFGMDYARLNGFLSLPLVYYAKSLDRISRSEEISGKELRGKEIYETFLENVAVVNLFKEDIFDIF